MIDYKTLLRQINLAEKVELPFWDKFVKEMNNLPLAINLGNYIEFIKQEYKSYRKWLKIRPLLSFEEFMSEDE